MGCNCKRINRFEEAFGVPEEENIFGKIGRLFIKVFLFLIVFGLSIIIAPCIAFVAVYKIVWGKNNHIILPAFIRKYME